MRQTIFTAVAIITVLFTSCSKEKIQPVAGETASKKLVSLTYSGSPQNPLNFTYDGKGRLVEMMTNQIDQKMTYVNNTVTGAFYDVNHFVYTEIQNGVLDNAGRLQSFDFVYRQPGGPDHKAKYDLTYSADGYLLKSVRTEYANGDISQDDYTWVNGNLVSDVNSFKGQLNYSAEYTYDTTINKCTIDVQDGIFNFFTDGLTGKRSRNLKKTKQLFNALHVKYLDYTFSYDMSADGYPAVIHTKDPVNNFETTQTLEFK